jgi:hypothetical protein
MRATSPNGAAVYEGRVQWSGELGFGVRPAEHGQADELEEPGPRESGEREIADPERGR